MDLYSGWIQNGRCSRGRGESILHARRLVPQIAIIRSDPLPSGRTQALPREYLGLGVIPSPPTKFGGLREISVGNNIYPIKTWWEKLSRKIIGENSRSVKSLFRNKVCFM